MHRPTVKSALRTLVDVARGSNRNAREERSMNEEHAVAIVAGEDEFFSGGVAAMLKRQVGYSTVLRAKSLLDLDELLALKMRIDLLVLDLTLPGAQGAMTVRQIHSTWPEMPIAAMTDSRDDHEI